MTKDAEKLRAAAAKMIDLADVLKGQAQGAMTTAEELNAWAKSLFDEADEIALAKENGK